MIEYSRPEHLSASSCGVLDECARKFYWSRGLGLKPQGVDLAQAFGSAVHKGWGAWYLKGTEAEAVAAFEACFGRYEGLDALRTLAKGRELVVGMARQFGGEEGETLGVELEFGFRLTEGMRYVGKVDRLEKREGQVRVHEWKTSKWPGEFVSRPNQQVVGYLVGAELGLGRSDVVEAVVTIGGVYKSSREGILKGIGGRSDRSVFTRETVGADEWEREEWERDIQARMAEMERCEKQAYWPKSTGACSKWGGCPFLLLCQSPVELREQLVETMFEKRESEVE